MQQTPYFAPSPLPAVQSLASTPARVTLTSRSCRKFYVLNSRAGVPRNSFGARRAQAFVGSPPRLGINRSTHGPDPLITELRGVHHCPDAKVVCVRVGSRAPPFSPATSSLRSFYRDDEFKANIFFCTPLIERFSRAPSAAALDMLETILPPKGRLFTGCHLPPASPWFSWRPASNQICSCFSWRSWQ